MDVLVERYLRRKIVSDSSSPKLYYTGGLQAPLHQRRYGIFQE